MLFIDVFFVLCKNCTMRHLGRLKYIVDTLHNTIQKSTLYGFKQFIQLNDQHVGWTIISDYCIDAMDKPNNCLTFSITPMSPSLYHTINWAIEQDIPKDLKKTKDIPDKTIKFLRYNCFFYNFNFLIDDFRYIISPSGDTKDTQRILLNDVKRIINQYKYDDNFAKTYKFFLQELERPNFNIALFNRIYIACVICSYLHIQILKYAKKATTVSWLSDRGKIADAYNHFAMCLYQTFYDNLRLKYKITNAEKSVIFGAQDANKKLFYDNCIKIPDYLAGTLASYDMEKNDIEKEKHRKIIDEVFANNNKITTFKLSFKDGIKCSKIIFSKPDC